MNSGSNDGRVLQLLDELSWDQCCYRYAEGKWKGLTFLRAL